MIFFYSIYEILTYIHLFNSLKNMSLYHSNERWQRSGITSQAEMLRRAPGFNRLYFDPKTGTLLQREGDVGSDLDLTVVIL